MKQLTLWIEHKCALRRITAPFEVEESIAIGAYEHTFWRLLSFRNPPRRFQVNRWHFEEVIRDEKQPMDLHLVRNPLTDKLEAA
jgi:hypothetical protein